MNCIIVDDECAAIELLESYIRKDSSLNLLASFSNSVEAFSFTQENQIDLIFLDINMPNISGLVFLDLLKGKSKVIMTTAYSEYALEGYKYDVVDYLTKPIAFEDFVRAVQKAKTRHNTTTNQSSNTVTRDALDDYIMVKSDHKGKLVKIAFADICYIESLKNYVSIYTLQDEQIISLLSMKELEDRLPNDYFIRTHKSFIIAVKSIKMIDGGEIVLKDVKNRIPLGVTYRNQFFTFIESKLIQP